MRTAENNETKAAGSAATLLLADLRFAEPAALLAQRGEVRLVGTCKRGMDVVSAAASLRPDVLLLASDSARSLLGLGTLLRRLRLRAPDTKVLVVSERGDCDFVCMILRHGARGRLRADVSVHELGRAIVAARNGDVWLERWVLVGALLRVVQGRDSRTGTARPVPALHRSSLTDRENEIVAFVARGMTNKEVAKRLNLSHETIKKHLKKVFVKLGVHHRTEVILHYG